MSTSKEKLMQIANALELLQNTLKCVICLEMLREPVSTRCGHHFCTLCLNNLLKLKKNGRATCPLCSALISRRGIVENDKIRRHVDGVTRVIKAIEADTAMDITLLRQNPSSTFEANSPVAGPSSKRNRSQIEVISPDDSDVVVVTDLTTPKASPPQKLSSAEKVKTWLIQNNNDFESKTILNEFSNPSKESPCDEDSDNEMISVSQVAPRTNNELSKELNETVKNVGRPALRRSLKMKDINLLTSGNVVKNTDNAFDKLLQSSGKGSSPKSKDKSTVSKGEENCVGKKQMSSSSDRSKSLSKEIISSKSPVVVSELMESHGLPTSQSSKIDTAPVLEDKDTQEHLPPDKEMPQLEPMSVVKNTAQLSKKKPSSESQQTSISYVDSCEIIPPSECAGEVPTMNLKHTLKMSDVVKESKKKTSRLSNVKKQADMKNATNQKLTNQVPKRHSSVGGDKSLNVSLSAVSKRYVSFLKLGRVLRERRFLPAGIRCNCINKMMFLLDLNDSSPEPPRVPPTRALAPEDKDAMDTATDTPAADTVSEDMFPISPEKIVQSGGVIAKRRSNNSSIASDGILDAVTVVFTQPPIARSLNYYDTDNTLTEPEKPALKSPCESLLSKKNEELGKTVPVPSGKSDSDEELVGMRKSSKRSTEKPGKAVPVPSGKSDSDEELVAMRKSSKRSTEKPGKAVPVPRGKSDSDEELVAMRKSSKRPRRLSSSDESEYDGEKSGRKKKKSCPVPLSDSRRKSIDFMQEEMPLPPSLLDQTLESPQRLVQGIKAKIAAGMLNTMDDVPRTSPRASPRHPRTNRQTSKLTNIDLMTPPRKKSSSDSDISDCEILEGTPQQQTSFNISRRSMKSAERSFSGKALDATVAHMESCTPGFVEPSQPSVEDLPPSFDSKKSGVKTSRKTNMAEEAQEDVGSPSAKRKRAQKSLTPQRPLREKNTTEERASNKTLNNISMSSTKEDRLLEKKKDATPRSKQKQQPKMQSPEKDNQKLCFVCSGLAGNFTALVQKLAAMVGADFSSKFDAKATHLIVKTKEDNTTDKTLKYLCAVAAKKWVVSFQWVVESIKEEKLLPEEKFEVLDTTGAEGPRLSRLSSKLLFSGFEFCIFPPLSDITKQQLEELVLMCGASVVSDPKEFSFGQDVLPLCLAEYDEEREQEYAGWIDRYCVPLVQHEWILDCIGRFSLVSFWSLLMSDVSDDNLRSMGYAPYLVEHPPSDSTEME